MFFLTGSFCISFCHAEKHMRLKLSFVKLAVFIIDLSRCCPKAEKGHKIAGRKMRRSFIPHLWTPRVRSLWSTGKSPWTRQTQQQKHPQHLSDPRVRLTDANVLFSWCQSAEEHNAKATALAENCMKLPGGIFYACCADNGQMAEESQSDSVGNQENLHTSLRISDKEAQKVIFYLPSSI